MAAPLTVVKIGGSTLGAHDTSLDDIAALREEGHAFALVHGGGATISEWLERHDIEARFVRGLRATDGRTLDVVVAVLAGLVNKRLVAELEARGARAIGLSGVDGALLRARRYDAELGFVGEIVEVDVDALRVVVGSGAVAVLAPIAIEVEGEALGAQLLNVNADTVAGELAAALSAERLILLTDVPGVQDDGAVYARLTTSEARELLERGVVSGGMIPKVEAALRAAESGVPTTILDGREAGALRSLLDAKEGDEKAGTRIS